MKDKVGLEATSVPDSSLLTFALIISDNANPTELVPSEPRITLLENFKHYPRAWMMLLENFKPCPSLGRGFFGRISAVEGLPQYSKSSRTLVRVISGNSVKWVFLSVICVWT